MASHFTSFFITSGPADRQPIANQGLRRWMILLCYTIIVFPQKGPSFSSKSKGRVAQLAEQLTLNQ